MLIIRILLEQMDKALALRDPRLQGLPFTSVQSIIAIVALYLLFVFRYGSKFMEDRKPYNIERLLLFYNAFQMFCNFSIFAYMFYFYVRWMGFDVNLYCEEIDYSDSVWGTQQARVVYCYYLVKLLDLFDTIFFVLRKRTRQISFLHVYHHIAILFGAFMGVSWFAGGHLWLLAWLNCAVHFVMYGYYFGSVYSTKLKTNLTVKRFITQLQIIQFTVLIIHMILPFFVNCTYPKPLLILGISQNAIMLMLFSDFYYKTYMKAPNSKSSLESRVECAKL